jgi:hypothetical protein
MVSVPCVSVLDVRPQLRVKGVLGEGALVMIVTEGARYLSPHITHSNTEPLRKPYLDMRHHLNLREALGVLCGHVYEECSAESCVLATPTADGLAQHGSYCSGIMLPGKVPDRTTETHQQAMQVGQP